MKKVAVVYFKIVNPGRIYFVVECCYASEVSFRAGAKILTFENVCQHLADKHNYTKIQFDMIDQCIYAE